MEQSSRLMFTH